MDSSTIYLICFGLYFLVGGICAVIYLTDDNEEDEAARKAIKSLVRPRGFRSNCDDLTFYPVAMWLLLWPIWFLLYWVGGSERREAEEALEEYHRKYPEAKSRNESETPSNKGSDQ